MPRNSAQIIDMKHINYYTTHSLFDNRPKSGLFLPDNVINSQFNR